MAVSVRTPPDATPSAHDARSRGVAAWEWILLAGILVTLMWSLVGLVRVESLLGHDEAVYAVRARTWVEHTTSSSWSAHRSPGLPVLAVPLLAAGAGPGALRLIGVAFAVALAVGTWVLARRVGGRVAAPIATATVALAPPLLEHGARLLTDLPATALLVWLLVVVHREAERPGGPAAGLLWAAPLAAGAIALRLGAALPLAIVAVGGAVVWPRPLVRSWRWVAATAGLTVVGLWWHIAGAVEAFGTPWGRILYTSQLTRSAEPGAALGQYVSQAPSALAGLPAGVLMVTAVLGAPLLVLRRRWDAAARGWAFLSLVGVGHLVGMGLSSEPEVRFVFVSIVVLCVLGASVVAVAARRLGRGAPAVAVLATAVVVGVAATSTVGDLVRERQGKEVIYEPMRAAAARIDERSGSSSCGVITSYVPQVEWLTGCTVRSFGTPPDVDVLDRVADVDDRYVLLLQDGKRQPEGDEIDAFVADAVEVSEWDVRDGLLGSAELYRLP